MINDATGGRLAARILLVGTLSVVCNSKMLLAQSEPAQNSLGDVGRTTRAEKNSKNHVVASRVMNEENAPRANWEKHTTSYWATIPPARLTVSVPMSSRPADHGIEVPLAQSGIYIPFGETIWSESFDEAAQEYLGMLLTRSRFSGAALKLDGVEDTTIGGQQAALVHFSFEFHGIPHEGLALFVSAPLQVMSLGCIYRNVDWEKASAVCEQMMNSAEVEIPTDYKAFKKPFR